MKQYICDRCGVIIPTYGNHNHVIFYDKDVMRSNIQYQSNNKYNECDLCDDCLEEEYDYRIEQQMEKGQDYYTPDSN